MTKQIVNKESIVIPAGTQEEFNRPNHPDFATTSELKAQEFSGLRHNSLTDDAEIWILGEIRRKVSKNEVLLDPDAINKAFEEVYCLHEVQPDVAALRRFRGEG